MTPDLLSEMKNLKFWAKKATPGEWHVEYGEHGRLHNTRIIAPEHILSRNGADEIHGPTQNIATIWNVSCTCIQGHQYRNQEYIAAANPDTILRLLSYIDELEKQIKGMLK